MHTGIPLELAHQCAAQHPDTLYMLHELAIWYLLLICHINKRDVSPFHWFGRKTLIAICPSSKAYYITQDKLTKIDWCTFASCSLVCCITPWYPLYVTRWCNMRIIAHLSHKGLSVSLHGRSGREGYGAGYNTVNGIWHHIESAGSELVCSLLFYEYPEVLVWESPKIWVMYMIMPLARRWHSKKNVE